MNVTQITRQVIAIVALSIILSGGTIPDKWFDMFGTVSEKDIQDFVRTFYPIEIFTLISICCC